MKMTMLDCSPKSAIPGALPKALSMDTVPALDLRPPILYPLHTLFSPDSDTWPSQHLAGQIERYFGDPAVTAFLNLPWYKGEALLGDREHDTEAELKSKAALPNMVTYLIFVNDGMRRFNTLNPQRPWGTIAGHITVKAINIEDMSAEIGLVITKEYQRTGLVYDVRSAILKYLYDLGFERIISRIMPENKKALQMVRHFAGNEGEEIFDEKGNKWIQLTVTRERMEQLMRLTEWDYPPKS
jgi:RimJ/RimL family protein N-acetyltransferase